MDLSLYPLAQAIDTMMDPDEETIRAEAESLKALDDWNAEMAAQHCSYPQHPCLDEDLF